MSSRIDKFGGPEDYNHYAVGWRTRWILLPVDQAGGIALGWHAERTIVHWPHGITGKGEIRTQFHHVIDVAPTVLELAHLPRSDDGQWCTAEAARGREYGLQLQ
jgi:hypothetical protein